MVSPDFPMNADHTQPTTGAIFAVNMLVATLGVSTYTFEEIYERLNAVGFCNIRLIQPDKQMDGLVEALKI